MVRIADVAKRDQWRRVDYESQSPNPRSSSSSGMSATDDPSPAQDAASANFRSGSSRDSYAAIAARTISAWLRPSLFASRRKRSTSASSRYRLVFFMNVGY